MVSATRPLPCLEGATSLAWRRLRCCYCLLRGWRFFWFVKAAAVVASIVRMARPLWKEAE